VRLLRNSFQLVLSVENANRTTAALGLLIVSASLVWMALGTFGVPALIRSAYRGESWPIFNSMIHGQGAHPLAEYIADWNRLKWSVLLVFFVVAWLGAAMARPEFRAAFSRSAPLPPEDTRVSQTAMPLANHREAHTYLRERRFWGAVAVLAFSVVQIALIAWDMQNPYPEGWDEAQYVNFAHKDIVSVRHSGAVGALKSLLLLDTARPPGFRLLALPISWVFGDTPTILRTVSMLCLGISVLLVHLAVARIAGFSSGALAAIFLCSNLSVVSASKAFSTESALYLAISTMLYCLFRAWTAPQASTWQWVGLGAALGLGALAKTSFLLIAGPAMILVLLLSSAKIIAGPSPKFLLKAAGMALLLASPWWYLNFRAAMGFANYSWKEGTRSSLGAPSLEMYARWLSKLTSEIGLPLVLLALLLLLSVLLKKHIPLGGRLDRLQVRALWVCLLSALPLVVAELLGNNHTIRLISPSFIPLAITFGIVAQKTRWTQVRFLQISAGVLVLFQLFVVVSGLQLFARKIDDERGWDWEGLRRISKTLQITNPLIVHLGLGKSFCPPEIDYPWVRANEPVRVEWLWQYDRGEINWQEVENTVSSSDIVLTIPQFAADGGHQRTPDNHYNAELARRLELNSRFMKPIILKMGPAQIEVLVFVRKPHAVTTNHQAPSA